jgi:NADPH:quinone reductase
VECDEPTGIESMDAFSRSLSFHWFVHSCNALLRSTDWSGAACREYMFCKPVNDFEVESQGHYLAQLKKAVDKGLIQSIVGKREILSTKSLRAMHDYQESGRAIGKVTFDITDTFE